LQRTLSDKFHRQVAKVQWIVYRYKGNQNLKYFSCFS
jgi:hypothetical protein